MEEALAQLKTDLKQFERRSLSTHNPSMSIGFGCPHVGSVAYSSISTELIEMAFYAGTRYERRKDREKKR